MNNNSQDSADSIAVSLCQKFVLTSKTVLNNNNIIVIHYCEIIGITYILNVV